MSLSTMNFSTALTNNSFGTIYYNSAISFDQLSPELQKELKELEQRIGTELRPLALESSLTMQKILEADSHKARCILIKYFMKAETKRLNTKKSLKGLFSTRTDASASMPGPIPPEEMITDEPEEVKKSSPFYDEPDAFQ